MFGSIATTFSNCFKIPELKSRILFTLLVLGICRLIAIIPIPGLDGSALTEYMEKGAAQAGGGLLGMYSLFTGGALERCALGALGIMPYISATIIIQLLGAVIPTLSKMAREEGGRVKMIQYGRYLTVLLCLGQGLVMALGWEHPERIFPNFDQRLVLMENLWWYRIQTVLLLTAATLLLMWLGEQITERGVGNGISLVITIGIVARFPNAMQSLYYMFFPPAGQAVSKGIAFQAIALLVLLVAVVGAVIAMTQAQRKIPVQYAQRSVGRKVVPGGSSFMPLRVNYAGVMPIIFAQAILMFPEGLFRTLGDTFGIKLFREIALYLTHGSATYLCVEALMIIFFSYFWVATMFNELQISDDLKKYGGYIPGVRPGQATSQFLHQTMSRITLAGAVFLAVIATIPVLLYRLLNVPFEVASFFGGTSILITVGVVLDTLRQMESHLLMRHYDGFLKRRGGGSGPRLRGRF
jgi:preprotein translocase subunit SecY